MLPDFEALAILAKVAETHSFSGAARELKLSKATVSKAIGRLEEKIGSQLFHRTTRRVTLTETGRQLAERAAAILSEGIQAEDEAMAFSAEPRGGVRLTAPVSFGLRYVAPLLAAFSQAYPKIRIDLDLSDERVDIVAGGFDAALRIAALADSSLIAKRICDMRALLVAAPDLLIRVGTPSHPDELQAQPCLGYALATSPGSWTFRNASGETATVQPAGPLRVNNGEALLPALLAGIGFGVMPDFLVRDALRQGKLTVVMPDWSLPQTALHWVTPPGALRPKRVDLLGKFLSERIARLRF